MYKLLALAILLGSAHRAYSQQRDAETSLDSTDTTRDGSPAGGQRDAALVAGYAEWQAGAYPICDPL